MGDLSSASSGRSIATTPFNAGGALFPRLMVAVGAIAVILAGFYIGNRLTDADFESRRDTTTRVLSDPMKDSLRPTKETAE